MDNTEINAMLSELFERLRREEKDLALLSKEVQILAKALETHAKEEMQENLNFPKMMMKVHLCLSRSYSKR